MRLLKTTVRKYEGISGMCQKFKRDLVIYLTRDTLFVLLKSVFMSKLQLLCAWIPGNHV